MRRWMSLAALGLVVVTLVACQAGPVGLTEQDQAAIRKVAEDTQKLATASPPDWATYVRSYYAEDATVLAANMPAATGHAAIQELFAAFPPVTSMKWDIIDVDGRGDLAYVRGNYAVTMAPPGTPPISESGKYVEVWRKQADGAWRVKYDSFSSDAQAPGLSIAVGAAGGDARPELKQLDMLVGEWRIDGEARMAQNQQPVKMSMDLKCSWFDGAHHVACNYDGATPQGPFHEVDFYGYDAATKTYALWSVDNSGMFGSGKLTIEKNTWTHVWDLKGSPQPMKARLTLMDMTPTSGNWKSEHAAAGGPWEVSGEGKYVKVK